MSEYRFYSVYGERLASTLPLPELDEIPAGPARWTATVVDELPEMRDGTLLGADLLYEEVHARLFQHADGHRIVVDDTGEFDLSRDRRSVAICPKAGSWPDFVRAHFTGRVLATALYLDGMLPLHGSSVATGEGVAGFLAPKGFGKSTLALALARAGAWLLSDDTLPLEIGTGRAWPGLHGLRVHEDSLAAVGMAGAHMKTREGKHVITEVGTERLFLRPMPVSALYLLVPVEPGATATERFAMPPALAAISVVAHVKIGRMLGPAEAPTMLARSADIVQRVKVYQLTVPRELAKLPATARQILEWHGMPKP